MSAKRGLKVREVAKDHFSSRAREKKPNSSQFVISILEGRNLLASDTETGKSDPVCFVWCGYADEIPDVHNSVQVEEEFLKTVVCPTTVDPIWKSTLEFPLDVKDIDTLATMKCVIFVRDEDIVDGNAQYDELGMIEFSFRDIIGKGKCTHNSIVLSAAWYDLKKSPGMRKIDGSVKLTLSIFLSDEDAAEVSEQLHDEETKGKQTIYQRIQNVIKPAHDMVSLGNSGGFNASVISGRPSTGSPSRRTQGGKSSRSQSRERAAKAGKAVATKRSRPRSANSVSGESVIDDRSLRTEDFASIFEDGQSVVDVSQATDAQGNYRGGGGIEMMSVIHEQESLQEHVIGEEHVDESLLAEDEIMQQLLREAQQQRLDMLTEEHEGTEEFEVIPSAMSATGTTDAASLAGSQKSKTQAPVASPEAVTDLSVTGEIRKTSKALIIDPMTLEQQGEGVLDQLEQGPAAGDENVLQELVQAGVKSVGKALGSALIGDHVQDAMQEMGKNAIKFAAGKAKQVVGKVANSGMLVPPSSPDIKHLPQELLHGNNAAAPAAFIAATAAGASMKAAAPQLQNQIKNAAPVAAARRQYVPGQQAARTIPGAAVVQEGLKRQESTNAAAEKGSEVAVKRAVSRQASERAYPRPVSSKEGGRRASSMDDYLSRGPGAGDFLENMPDGYEGGGLSPTTFANQQPPQLGYMDPYQQPQGYGAGSNMMTAPGGVEKKRISGSAAAVVRALRKMAESNQQMQQNLMELSRITEAGFSTMATKLNSIETAVKRGNRRTVGSGAAADAAGGSAGDPFDFVPGAGDEGGAPAEEEENADMGAKGLSRSVSNLTGGSNSRKRLNASVPTGKGKGERQSVKDFMRQQGTAPKTSKFEPEMQLVYKTREGNIEKAALEADAALENVMSKSAKDAKNLSPDSVEDVTRLLEALGPKPETLSEPVRDKLYDAVASVILNRSASSSTPFKLPGGTPKSGDKKKDLDDLLTRTVQSQSSNNPVADEKPPVAEVTKLMETIGPHLELVSEPVRNNMYSAVASILNTIQSPSKDAPELIFGDGMNGGKAKQTSSMGELDSLLMAGPQQGDSSGPPPDPRQQFMSADARQQQYMPPPAIPAAAAYDDDLAQLHRSINRARTGRDLNLVKELPRDMGYEGSRGPHPVPSAKSRTLDDSRRRQQEDTLYTDREESAADGYRGRGSRGYRSSQRDYRADRRREPVSRYERDEPEETLPQKKSSVDRQVTKEFSNVLDNGTLQDTMLLMESVGPRPQMLSVSVRNRLYDSVAIMLAQQEPLRRNAEEMEDYKRSVERSLVWVLALLKHPEEKMLLTMVNHTKRDLMEGLEKVALMRGNDSSCDKLKKLAMLLKIQVAKSM